MPRKRSLKQKVFLTILAVSILLFLAVNGVNFTLNCMDTMQSYKRESASDLRFAVSLIDVDYLEKIYGEVREIYDNTPDDIKGNPFSKEYRALLEKFIDDDFWEAREVLVKCKEQTGLDSVSLLMMDEEKEAVVFVIDGYELSGAYYPGQWLSEEITDIDTPDQIREIVDSDIKMFFDHGDLNGWIATNYVEVRDSNGDLLGYASGDINITDFVGRMERSLVIYFLNLVVLIIIMVMLISRSLEKKVIEPVNKLAKTAQDYTKRDKAVEEEEQVKEYFSELGLSTGDEIETLWESLSDMEKDMNDTMHRIREMAAEKEKVEAELGVATKIQAGMLPKKFPAFPGRNEFEVYASMDPAKEVGGDLYDFFLVDDDHLCLVVGDVSGKGVPASLFMVVAITAIRNIARTVKNIPEIMQRVNYQMCKNNEESLFVTVWLGIYCISEKKLRFSNAGHEYPAIYRASKKCYELYNSEHDIPMGIMEDIDFAEDEITLEKGDKLFIYTDGVPEATRGDDALFDTERMLKCLNDNADKDGKGTLEAMGEAVNEFIEGAPQFDDLTMLYFEVKQ